MKLHDLKPAEGSRRRRKRVGRGISAGQGKTSGRGTKGEGARTGGGKSPYFEGGQLPLVRRLPFKRGFTNIRRIEYAEVNVGRLEGFNAGAEIDPMTLAAAGLIKEPTQAVAVLGEGALQTALKVKAHRFTKTARDKIEAAGGSVEVIEAING
jgi:large subunit ribosomal protein L15